MGTGLANSHAPSRTQFNSIHLSPSLSSLVLQAQWSHILHDHRENKKLRLRRKIKLPPPLFYSAPIFQSLCFSPSGVEALGLTGAIWHLTGTAKLSPFHMCRTHHCHDHSERQDGEKCHDYWQKSIKQYNISSWVFHCHLVHAQDAGLNWNEDLMCWTPHLGCPLWTSVGFNCNELDYKLLIILGSMWSFMQVHPITPICARFLKQMFKTISISSLLKNACVLLYNWFLLNSL